MTKQQRDELRKLVDKVPQGPWVVYSQENSEYTRWSVCHDNGDPLYENHKCVGDAVDGERGQAEANAEYIAALSPEVVRYLLYRADERDALREELEGLRGFVDAHFQPAVESVETTITATGGHPVTLVIGDCRKGAE